MKPDQTFVESLLDLQDPLEPARRLPAVLRAVLPSPMASSDNWRRFVHHDLEDLTPAERKWEALRLRTAAARLEYERVPRWVFKRLSMLAA